MILIRTSSLSRSLSITPRLEAIFQLYLLDNDTAKDTQSCRSHTCISCTVKRKLDIIYIRAYIILFIIVSRVMIVRAFLRTLKLTMIKWLKRENIFSNSIYKVASKVHTCMWIIANTTKELIISLIKYITII